MPGFMPGIHVFAAKEDVDGRDKPGHDDVDGSENDHITSSR
jgi:hypothetical protein